MDENELKKAIEEGQKEVRLLREKLWAVRMSNRERRADRSKKLAELTAKQKEHRKQALLLHHDGLSNKQIARKLGVRTSGVKAMIEAAVKVIIYPIALSDLARIDLLDAALKYAYDTWPDYTPTFDVDKFVGEDFAKLKASIERNGYRIWYG